MNIYLAGILITFVAYMWVGALVSKRVKDINDFYVAGRNAPTFLITGSLVASFIGTGMFMGDAGEAYKGYFGPILLAVGIMSVGYILGSVFFGRYLRRSGVMTIPEFFGKRFDSPALKSLATITSTFTMLVYSLSTVQGGATLMAIVSGISYETCVILVAIAFTLITAFSGASGVLITDTIMFGIFSIATILGGIVISQATGGWLSTVAEMANYQPLPDILAGSGNLNYSYPTAGENFVWAIGYGIAWLSVLMIAPWQSSRYLMAKDEHTVIRSSILASFSVTILNFLVLISGVFVHKINPNIAEPSHVLIWASINVMPTILGIVVLAGVLAAALSSATTFLSLIGSNLANDILKIKGPHSLLYGRMIVMGVGAIIALICVINPPQIFWIIYLGATIISCSWLPVSIASIWSKRVTKTGAFWSMLVGFLVSSALKLYLGISGIKVPIYLDPFFMGFGASIIALVIGSALTQVTDREKETRRELFIMPDMEKNPKEIKKTKAIIATTIPLGVLTTTILLVLWVIPYLNGL